MPHAYLVRALAVLTIAAAAGMANSTPAASAPALATASPPAHAASASRKKPPAARVKLVDINSASRAELKKLPGVDDAMADRIIANRPYLTKAELVTRKVMLAGPYMSIRLRVVAVNKTPPKART